MTYSLFAVVLIGLALVQPAKAQMIEVTPDQPSLRLDDALVYWPSLGPIPRPALKAFRKNLFSRTRQTVSHGSNHAPEMWFAVDLKNDSFDDGRGGDPFTLVFDAPSVVGYRLFLVREDGLTENLVDFSAYRGFDPSQHLVNRLVSPEFVLAPGERVTILAHLQLGIVHHFSVELFRPEALTTAGLGWAASLTAFYAFCFSCLVIGLGFQFAMNSRVGVIYVVLFLLFLATLAYGDSLFYRFVFPHSPDLHRWTGYALFFLLPAAFCALVSEGLRGSGEHRRRVSWVMLSLSAVSLAGLGLAVWMDAGWTIFAALAICVVALVANIFLPGSFRSSEVNPNVGIRVVSAVALFSGLSVIALSLLGLDGAGLGLRVSTKLSYAVLMVAAMLFMTGNLIVIRRRHLSAVESRVAALEAETERSRQLLDSERAYAQARDIAAARRRQLATASHDIKQPLMSLRATFDAIASNMDPEVRDRLRDAFTYLENLSHGIVDDAVTEDDPEGAASSPDAIREVYALSVPLDTVGQMFADEAAGKGLDLRVAKTGLKTTAPPLVLMRILTNLVSNAVKHSEAGGILVGVRQAGPSIWVCDTGPGMTDADLRVFQRARTKGPDSEGHGLGLSVCFELAAANDMNLSVRSVPGRGSVFAISLAQHRP